MIETKPCATLCVKVQDKQEGFGHAVLMARSDRGFNRDICVWIELRVCVNVAVYIIYIIYIIYISVDVGSSCTLVTRTWV